jgi:hypothetical protein
MPETSRCGLLSRNRPRFEGLSGWSRHFELCGRLKFDEKAGGELDMSSYLAKLWFGQYAVVKSVM